MISGTKSTALRNKYIAFFTALIDDALAGKPRVAVFTNDIALELYMGDDEALHWRVVDGRASGGSAQEDGAGEGDSLSSR